MGAKNLLQLQGIFSVKLVYYKIMESEDNFNNIQPGKQIKSHKHIFKSVMDMVQGRKK